MFRFTFSVTYTDKDGNERTADFFTNSDSDNLFDARAELVYRLSRQNTRIFAPFSFELKTIEQWKDGKWEFIESFSS